MFKLDDSPHSSDSIEHIQIRKNDQRKRKGPGIGIKLSTQTLEQNKPNLYNRRKIDIVSSSGKTQENTDRSSGFKGIQVTSGRSSTERRPLVTSRSRQKQKQSRQIKSQTNTSQFQYDCQAKDPSIQDRSPYRNDYDDICRGFESKLKEIISKYQMAHRVEVTQLTDIINSNQERINNLIISINMLVEKSQKKERMIEKLEDRLASLTSYHEQCYAFSVERCNDLQNVFRIISEQLDQEGLTKEKLEMKVKVADEIVKNIFMKQRKMNRSYKTDANQQIDRLAQMLDNVVFQVNYLEQLYGSGVKINAKEKLLQNYLLQIKNSFVSAKRDSNIVSTNDTQHESTSQKQFNNVIKSLQVKIEALQIEKNKLKQVYQDAQEKAKVTIWELSNLLHKNQRLLETSQLYNKQIENKLIDSKLKQNTLRIEMQSFYKNLEISKNYQYNELEKQKQCFKERFQNLFRHNQYLQEVNCKNKIDIINYQKDMQKMSAQLQNLKNQLSRTQINLQEYEKTKIQISAKAQEEKYNLEKSIKSLKQENIIHKSMISENAKQILKLQLQIKQLIEEKNKLQLIHNCLVTQFTQLKKQFDEEQLYSEHLQQQNQQLRTTLNEYKGIFENQSNMFKKTIDKLKEENTELHKNLQLQSDKIFASQPKRYENKLKLTKPLSNDDIRMRKSIETSNKVQMLKTIFEEQTFVLPVLCEIDSCGYLKYHEQGTYVYDKEDNTIELNEDEKDMALRLNIVKFFQ